MMIGFFVSCGTKFQFLLTIFLRNNTLLQLNKRRGSTIDKSKQGTTGTDDDSLRTSIVDESAIVWRINTLVIHVT